MKILMLNGWKHAPENWKYFLFKPIGFRASRSWRRNETRPGKIVQIDAPCLDCGSPIKVEMKDGVVQNAEPEGIMGYVSVPFRDWRNDLPYA